MENKYKSASLVLGIISSAFAFFSAAGAAMSVVGLSLGLKGSERGGKPSAGVILNLAAVLSLASAAVSAVALTAVKLVKNRRTFLNK